MELWDASSTTQMGLKRPISGLDFYWKSCSFRRWFEVIGLAFPKHAPIITNTKIVGCARCFGCSILFGQLFHWEPCSDAWLDGRRTWEYELTRQLMSCQDSHSYVASSITHVTMLIEPPPPPTWLRRVNLYPHPSSGNEDNDGWTSCRFIWSYFHIIVHALANLVLSHKVLFCFMIFMHSPCLPWLFSPSVGLFPQTIWSQVKRCWVPGQCHHAWPAAWWNMASWKNPSEMVF